MPENNEQILEVVNIPLTSINVADTPPAELVLSDTGVQGVPTAASARTRVTIID